MKIYKVYVHRWLPAAIREKVAKMKQANLIKESNIPYASTMVCVLKSDGQLWVCIDFRMVKKTL